MQKTFALLFGMFFAVGLIAAASAGLTAKMELKAGDEVYACNCGQACNCDTLSRNPGKCTCSKDMVKAIVTRVDESTSLLKASGWEKERSFKTTGQYACACGEACMCGSISQNAGKCTCGTAMQKVK